jgi:hypothetical protein
MDGSSKNGRPSLPRYTRRLSDKILIAFHQGCDQGDVEVARRLLDILDAMVQRSTDLAREGGERRIKETLVAAHERLWQMQHPEAVSC